MPTARPLVDVDRGRLLAKLTRELLTTRRYDTLADLKEDLKRTCARYRIGWTNDAISDALRLLTSNLPLPGAHVGRVLPARAEDPPTITRAEAAAILQRLGIQL